MKVTMHLDEEKEIILTPKSENWKVWVELIKDGETYTVERKPNSTSIILKQVK